MSNPRQIAFYALQDIYRRGAYTDIALDRVLNKSQLKIIDRGLVAELVYGIVRRQKTLDVLIDQLGKKKAQQQPPDLRIILHLGLYQLRYLSQIPVSAAVNTSVDLGKTNGFSKLAGVVNGVLRQYLRLAEDNHDPLQLPDDPIEKIAIYYSFPEWLVELWQSQLDTEATEKLCQWFNQPPSIDLRVNILKTSIEKVESAFINAGIKVRRIPHLPQGLRLASGSGAIHNLPGFQEGWWTIQDSSAQLVSHLLDPQPGETIIDACAAPGGKTTHIAELIGDKGIIWAGDVYEKRLKKLKENVQRLQLQSIKICPGDSRTLSQFQNLADRVLLDAPCSGLGTLHKRPDLRWRQTPSKLNELAQLQQELLEITATWVKPKGILVYATCTLNQVENERVIQTFLQTHPDWYIQPPKPNSLFTPFVTSSGWIKVLPYLHNMDGFFMVKLIRGN